MSRRDHRAAALAAALSAFAVVSLAEDSNSNCPAIDHPAAVAAPNAAPRVVAAAPGVRASIDPVTGALRPPTAEERAELAARKREARAEAMRNVRIVVHPDGRRTAELGDAFLFDVVVDTQPDGTVSYRCVPRRAEKPAQWEER